MSSANSNTTRRRGAAPPPAAAAAVVDATPVPSAARGEAPKLKSKYARARARPWSVSAGNTDGCFHVGTSSRARACRTNQSRCFDPRAVGAEAWMPARPTLNKVLAEHIDNGDRHICMYIIVLTKLPRYLFCFVLRGSPSRANRDSARLYSFKENAAASPQAVRAVQRRSS